MVFRRMSRPESIGLVVGFLLMKLYPIMVEIVQNKKNTLQKYLLVYF